MQTWKHCFQCDFLGQGLWPGVASDGKRNAGGRNSVFWAELKELKTTHLTISFFLKMSLFFSQGRNSTNQQGRNYLFVGKPSLNAIKKKKKAENSIPIFLSILRKVPINIGGICAHKCCFMHQSAPSDLPACTVLPHEKLLCAWFFQMPERWENQCMGPGSRGC